MNLVSVYRERQAVLILYDLLKERTPEQSISHRRLPTIEEHQKFVYSQPYLCWYLIQVDGVYVGSVYLTKQREVGIFIFRAHQGRGYGRRAIEFVRQRWPGRVLANVNPANEPSKLLFSRMGGKVIQWTYELPEPP